MEIKDKGKGTLYRRDNSEETTVPPLSEQLIEYLESLYPIESPDLDSSDRMIWFLAGRQDVVRCLRSKFEEQQETN